MPAPSKRLPTYFLSHGGGPWAYMTGEFRSHFGKLEASLKALPAQLPAAPRAILVISGHWEERDFSVMSAAQPPMVYDYGGFPPHTYHVRYAAPGAPELASRVRGLIEGAGFPARLDPNRGFDHGTFVPLVVAFPNADIPIFQVSLRADFDPESHIRLGQALAPLRDEGVLIIGSGLSYHNLRRFGPTAAAPSREFDAWLQRALIQSHPEQRHQLLLEWEKAPSARAAHPQEDHFIPLMVAVGAALNEKAEIVYHETDFFGGITVSSFRFGD